LSNGQPIDSAVRERELKVIDLRRERDVKIEEEQSRIENATNLSQKEIYSEILTDLGALEERTFYANTLNSNLLVSIDEFDGDKKSWEMKYYVFCDGVELYSGEGEIRYSDLEKMKPSGMNYFDAVDMYDSLFRCNEPVLTFEIAYRVKSVKHEVSTYEYEFDSLRAFDTTELETRKDSSLSGANFVCAYNMDTYGKIKRLKQMSPGYDVRTEQDMQVVRENERKVREEKEKEVEAEEKNQMKKELANKLKESNVFFFGVGGSFAFGYQLSYFEFKNKNQNYTSSSSRGCWMMGGTGELDIGKMSKTVGYGVKIHFGFLGDLSNKVESYYLPITLQCYIEKHFTNFLSTAGFVLRPQASIGIGGGGAWGSSVELDGSKYSFKVPAGFVLTGSGGIYFDFYISKQFAFYVGPAMTVSAIFLSEDIDRGYSTKDSIWDVKGLFQPSFNIGIRYANIK
ncbi:MAG: hypothetical protein II220_07440, partial [Spirochaetales bacterium]|nr:hypothetical protein [Spirochaetales bacterium]